MRRFDKKTNITKANILAEQRYITEGVSQMDVQLIVDAQNSLQGLMEDSIFASKLSGNDVMILRMAFELCQRLESQLTVGGLHV
jgi:hypothetical protein